jgi:hypothetical protein
MWAYLPLYCAQRARRTKTYANKLTLTCSSCSTSADHKPVSWPVLCWLARASSRLPLTNCESDSYIRMNWWCKAPDLTKTKDPQVHWPAVVGFLASSGRQKEPLRFNLRDGALVAESQHGCNSATTRWRGNLGRSIWARQIAHEGREDGGRGFTEGLFFLYRFVVDGGLGANQRWK